MTDSLWNAKFTSDIAAIFDAAESDLRALGFGEIERGDLGIALVGRHTPGIALELAHAWQRREHAGSKRLEVRFKCEWVDGRADENIGTFAEQVNLARRNLATAELADRWVQRWGSMRWSDDDVYDPEAKAAFDAECARERNVAGARATLTDRRREVLFKISNGEQLSGIDRRMAKSMPELVADGDLTDLGRDVVTSLQQGVE